MVTHISFVNRFKGCRKWTVYVNNGFVFFAVNSLILLSLELLTSELLTRIGYLILGREMRIIRYVSTLRKLLAALLLILAHQTWLKGGYVYEITNYLKQHFMVSSSKMLRHFLLNSRILFLD